MKRIVITGNGKSASWRIRGEQLGGAIGAEIAPKLAAPRSNTDLVVIVKRIDPRLIERLHATKTSFVWDIVDAWPQPHGNLWDRGACMRWLKGQLDLIKPRAVVAATQAMADDIREVFKGPVPALPHHARPGQPINPISRVVKTVGYEGGVAYLGKWQRILEAECTRRGWRFVVNPPALANLDIVVAMREADGYAPKHWKSNVKLANAQGTGTPFVGNRERGYIETDNSAAFWADTPAELRAAFDTLADATVRHHISRELLAAPFTLASVAANYREWLEGL